MQVTTTVLGDPWKLADDLNSLAAANEIQIVKKTVSSGTFVVVYDNTAPTGQTAVVIAGCPQTLVNELNAISALPATVEIVEQTFSSAH